MVVCCAFGCKNRTAKRKEGITFHRLPKNEERRSAWMKAIRRKNWIPTANTAICSEHFLEKDMDRTSLAKVRIREDAVPSIFPGFPSYLQTVVKRRKPPARRIFIQKDSGTKVSHLTNSEPCNDTSTAADNALPNEELLDDTLPTKQELEMELQCASEQYKIGKRKVKRLQQSKRRQLKKIADLKIVISALRKICLVNKNGLEILQNIPISDEIGKHNDNPYPSIYDTEIRTFALALNCFSPKAYKLIRKNFVSCLPHPMLVSKWHDSDRETEISVHSLLTLKEKVNNSQHPDLCDVVLDEMSPRRHTECNGVEYHRNADIDGPSFAALMQSSKSAMKDCSTDHNDLDDTNVMPHLHDHRYANIHQPLTKLTV